MASPIIKIYTASGDYVASSKDTYVACGAALFAGDGSTIRLGHKKRDTLATVRDHHWDSFDQLHQEVLSNWDIVRDNVLRGLNNAS